MFPSQKFVDNIAPYTDAIYITTIVDGDSYKSMNSNIIIYFTSDSLHLRCTNDNKKKLKIQVGSNKIGLS